MRHCGVGVENMHERVAKRFEHWIAVEERVREIEIVVRET